MKKSIIRLSFIAAALTLALSTVQSFAQTPPPGSPVATHGQLSVANGQIVNKDGEPVQLRGMSLYWSIHPTAAGFYNKDVVKYIASDWNASLIRAAMGVEACWGATGHPQDGTGSCNTGQAGYLYAPDENRQRVETVVDGAIEAGIYVIIDWHSHMAEKFTDKAVEFFQYMANKYKDVPNVIYEIYNEPLNQNWGTVLKPYMQTVTDAIRAIDEKNIIIIGTGVWCQRPDQAVDNPVEGTNLAYSAHFYAASTDPAHNDLLRSRIYYAMKVKGQAVFISEFGSVNSDGAGQHNATSTDKWMAFLDENKISWANWSLSSMSEISAVLSSGASTNPGVGGAAWADNNLKATGLYMREKLKSPPTSEKLYNYLNINIVGQGTVTPRWGDGTTGAAPYVYEKTESPQLFLRASVTGPGWQFVGWSGDLIGTDVNSSTFTMNGTKTVTATFTNPNVSVLPTRISAKSNGWSVRRGANGGLTLRGPSSSGAASIALYDMRGKMVGKQTYNAGASDRQVAIGTGKLSAGTYLLVVRNKATKREMFSTRVTVAQ